MLGGDFNENNVEIHCKGGSVKSKIQAADYLINAPVCSCHGRDYGVTLSLKNTMTYLNNASTWEESLLDLREDQRDWLERDLAWLTHRASLSAPQESLSWLIPDFLFGCGGDFREKNKKT